MFTCTHLDFRIFVQSFYKLYFCLGFSFYLYRTFWKRKSGMENVSCEIFMNEVETKTNLMEEKNPNLQT